MLRKFKEKYGDIKYGVRNLVRWFPIIWADRNWDYYFLGRIIVFKSRIMADAINKAGIAEDHAETAAELREFADLIANATGPEDLSPTPKQDARLRRACLTKASKLMTNRLFSWWD